MNANTVSALFSTILPTLPSSFSVRNPTSSANSSPSLDRYASNPVLDLRLLQLASSFLSQQGEGLGFGRQTRLLCGTLRRCKARAFSLSCTGGCRTGSQCASVSDWSWVVGLDRSSFLLDCAGIPYLLSSKFTVRSDALVGLNKGSILTLDQ